MSSGGLRIRETEAWERMDDPDCGLQALRTTYAQFRVVNRLVAGWRRVYLDRIRPLMSPAAPTTVLDVGFGGGDVARCLARWARRDGLPIKITGIDPDPRAVEFVSSLRADPDVTFRQATSAQLVGERAHFDAVVSNHVLHHLDGAELAELLADSRQLARRLVVHNDIARSRVAYTAYDVVSRPFGRRSFVRDDGMLSIRRSYRRGELSAAAGPEWQVVPQRLARLLLLWQDCRAGPGHGSGPT